MADDTRAERLAEIERTITTMVHNLTTEVRRGSVPRIVGAEQRIIGLVIGFAEMALPMDGWRNDRGAA